MSLDGSDGGLVDELGVFEPIDEAEEVGAGDFELKNYVLGPLQLCLKAYSLVIALLIVSLFESKRIARFLLNQIEGIINSTLSTLLFLLVLINELVLSLRRSIHSRLHSGSSKSRLILPDNIKYSEIHNLFWSNNKGQKIRVSDDFQSFEIIKPSNVQTPYTRSKVLQQTKLDPTRDSNDGISLSFVSSPGISRVQQFNNKYKEKWKNRPHWWRIDNTTPSQNGDSGSPEPIVEGFLGDEDFLKRTGEADETSLKPSHDDSEGEESSTSASQDVQHSIKTSSPNENTPTIKPYIQNTSKLHDKFKLVMGSNHRQNLWNGYSKELKLLRPPAHS